MRKFYIALGRVLFVVLLPIMRPVLRRTERVYVAIIYDKQVVLIKNWLARDTWRLPGGGISKGETPEAAAVREMKEELRLILTESKLIRISSRSMETDSLGYRFTTFAYQMSTHPRRLEDQYEIVDYGTFFEAPKETQPEVRQTIELLKKKRLL
jgi:8-oxo-dGTP pyrophosphatase MutT (NUDIX family)